MASIYKSVNAATGIAVNPTQAAQASPFFSSEYASTQASREVQTQYGPKLFDITMGRVGAGYVEQTPTTIGGSPIVPRIDANFQMAKEQATRPVYEIKVHSPVDTPYNVQDVYTAAGTKYLNKTRDSYLTTPTRQFAQGSVDPITSCAQGQELMLQRTTSAGPAVQVNAVPQSAYYNENSLQRNSTLVGLYAAEPSKMSFNNAYNPRMMSNVGVSLNQSPIFASPLSSLSGAGFSRSNISIP